jgi:hypothetical protein
MKQLFLSIGFVIVTSIAATTPVAAQTSCDLGPSEIGQKACRAVRVLVRYTAKPSGAPDCVIEDAMNSVEAALKTGIAGAVLIEMQLPWLKAKALAAYAQRCVEVVEESERSLPNFVRETEYAIAQAKDAGMDVAALETRLLLQKRLIRAVGQ